MLQSMGSLSRVSVWLWLLLQPCHYVSLAWIQPSSLRTRMPVAIRATTMTTTTSTTTTLYHRRHPDNEEQSSSSQALIQKESIRFLGRGANAIVRPGCVLVAPKHEFHHFYRRAAILIHGMGPADDGSGDYLIRGIILDHPTPFTLKEMMEHNPVVVHNPLGNNFLFRGGDKGNDGVILLHAQAHWGRAEIGTSGLYEGGWQQALDMCQAAAAADDNDNDNVESTSTMFKAFFNHCEFTEQELEDLLDSEEDGDAWVSLEVPADFCLNPDFDRGDAWSLLRNAVTQMEIS